MKMQMLEIENGTMSRVVELQHKTIGSDNSLCKSHWHEQKACSDDHWLPGCALSHQSGPDNLVTQAFANIVKTMFDLVIPQMIALSAAGWQKLRDRETTGLR